MIIHPLTPQLENGEICVAARVEMETPPYDLPETLWFRFPEAQAHMVSERADGFAVALLCTALGRGERIRVRGELSPRVAYGLQEFQRVQLLRKPEGYRDGEIEICADRYTRAESGGQKAASTFSGGVDSFLTVWQHLPQNEQYAGNEISFALFVQGMDIGLHDNRSFELCRKEYARLMAGWGVQLLTARTNVRQFDESNLWITACIQAVMGLGHLLGRELARLYVPANDAYAEFPTGTVAVLQDALLSSESLEIVEDGARLTKYEKIVALAQVTETYDTLRVCSAKSDGLRNCCRCGKCLTIMTGLEVCGTLGHFKTFPLALDRAALRGSTLSYASLGIYQSILDAARAEGRYDLVADMYVRLARNYARWGGKWVKRRFGSA